MFKTSVLLNKHQTNILADADVHAVGVPRYQNLNKNGLI